MEIEKHCCTTSGKILELGNDDYAKTMRSKVDVECYNESFRLSPPTLPDQP